MKTKHCLFNIYFRVNFKNIIRSCFLFFSLFTFCFLSAAPNNTIMRNITSLQLVSEMGVGWNLGNTLDSHDAAASAGLVSETFWGNDYTTDAMLNRAQLMGFKSVRIPVTWYQHTGNGPTYTIDPAWLNRVQTVVDYAFNRGLYVIINMHHENAWTLPTTAYADQNQITTRINLVWKQIATKFQSYGDHLIFETLNEPGGFANETQGIELVNKYNLAAVATIRGTGQNNATRFIMIPTYGSNWRQKYLSALTFPQDASHIIVSVHAYYPYGFCEDDAAILTWGTPAEQTDLRNKIFIPLYNTFISKGRAVILGEFANNDKNDEIAREAHASFYVREAGLKQIHCLWWDDGTKTPGKWNSTFLERSNSASLVYTDYNLRVALINAANSTFPVKTIKTSDINIPQSNVVEKAFAYPNPVADKLNLQLKGGAAQISIFNYNGKEVYSSKTNNQVVDIDVANLNPGIYCIKVTSSGQIVTQKIIKK